MCGRFSTYDIAELRKRYGAQSNAQFHANYNAAPTQLLPVLTTQQAEEIEIYKWGMVKNGHPIINIRDTTVKGKGYWNKLLGTQRCIVPASGFYEFKGKPGQKHAFRFTVEREEIFSMAGLYDGNEFTIITTEPNEFVRVFHDRMPIIIPKSQEKDWLSDGLKVKEYEEMIIPFAEKMKVFEVSPEVGNVRNNFPELLEPIAKTGLF